MFIIIGGDQKEYGPATTEQVRAWIAAGRANLDTKAKALGNEEWRRLGDFAEFGGSEATPPMLPTRAGSAQISAGTRTTGPELASRGVRTGAALLNAVLYFLCMMPGSAVMSRLLLEKNPDLAKGGIPRLDELDLSGFAEGVIWVWVGLLIAMLVQGILIALRGQNLGKILLGGRVVRASDGQPAGFLRGALLRFYLPVMLAVFLNVLFPLGCIFLVIDYCFMFRNDQRCLHDLIAGTKVVRT
jgi:uncharacterized RDD family membrane protein YckC